jgi:translation initiation factor 6
MRIEKKNILSSPYVGIFASLTDKLGLFPLGLPAEEIKNWEDIFQVEIIPTSIAGSALLGVLCRGNSQGFLLPSITEERELKTLEEQGIKVKQINITAIGNLLTFNDAQGLASELIGEKMVKEIEKFLKIKLTRKNLAEVEITGSSLLVTNKGFIVNPNVSEEEFTLIKKTFGLEGSATTANYGDPFVSNNVLANSSGVVAGINTSGPEMVRIDEALVR